MSTDKKANAPGRTEPIAHDLGKIRVGRLPTMNQDEYPGLSEWWVQLRIGEDGEEVLARVYGNTPEQAHSRATALAAQSGQALTQQTLDDVKAGIPARDAEIEALRREIEALQAQQDASKVDAALAEMVHAMFRSANSIPVTRITIDRKQYEAAIDAARKEPEQ